jgi:hypothetical protein
MLTQPPGQWNRGHRSGGFLVAKAQNNQFHGVISMNSPSKLAGCRNCIVIDISFGSGRYT